MAWSWRCSNCSTINTLSNECSYCSQMNTEHTSTDDIESNEESPSNPTPGGNTGNTDLNHLNSMAELNEEISQIQRRIPQDVQNLIYELRNVIPFIVIMLGLFIINHVAGICMYVVSRMVFQNANTRIMEQVTLKNQRNSHIVIMIMLVCCIHVYVIYGIMLDSAVFPNYLLFMYLPEDLTFMNVLWVASMNDVSLQLITVFLKAIATLIDLNFIGLRGGGSSESTKYRNKRKVYSSIELLSLLYRNAIGTPLWYSYYLVNSVSVHSTYGESMFIMVYTSVKISILLFQVSAFNAAVQRMFSMDLAYGSRISSEELTEEGISTECSICRDNLSSPVQLQCDHVFCDDCVSEWLDRESTCPLCRADIPSAGKIRYSDGSTSMMVQMF